MPGGPWVSAAYHPWAWPVGMSTLPPGRGTGPYRLLVLAEQVHQRVGPQAFGEATRHFDPRRVLRVKERPNRIADRPPSGEFNPRSQRLSSSVQRTRAA